MLKKIKRPMAVGPFQKNTCYKYITEGREIVHDLSQLSSAVA